MQPAAKTHTLAPVLVLGLGNVLLGDDGVGPALVEQLSSIYDGTDAIECLDGGTQGLALLGYLGGRKALVILDAFSAGGPPGAVTVLNKSKIGCQRFCRATTAHEGNAGELLAAANLLGELPECVYLVGVEPERVRTGLGLSASVQQALPSAVACARELLETILAEICAAAEALPA